MAVYLQGLSLLVGLVAVAIPVIIGIAGIFVSRNISNRIDSMAADLDEALDRIKELEDSRPQTP